MALSLPSVLIALAFAYAVYVPLPAEYSTDLIKMHAIEMVMRITYFYPMTVLKYVSSDWQIWWSRKSLGALVRILRCRNYINPDDNVRVSSVQFDDVPVIVYEPKHRLTDGAIVFVHGGGFVMFDADAFDQFTRQLAVSAGVTVFSIDYRTAPEHKFPTALDDCDRAISHLLKKAYVQYSIDPSRVALMGDSAGGNLAAGSAFRLLNKTDQLPKAKLQVLLYPLVQFIDFQTPSYKEATMLYGGSSLVDPESLARVFSLYVGLNETDISTLLRNGHVSKETIVNRVPYILEDIQYADIPFMATPLRHNHSGSDYRWTNAEQMTELQAKLEHYLFDPELSPLMRKDLSQSPKTLLITCQYDPLRDEGYWYAKRLRKAGVNVTWRHYENAFHGIINLHDDLYLAERMLNDVVRFIGENL